MKEQWLIPGSFAFERFPMPSLEIGLVIKCIEVRHASAAKDLDDASRSGCDVRCASTRCRCQRVSLCHPRQ